LRKTASALLKDHGLRITDVRKSCVSVLSKANGALSNAEIESQLEGVDRITLYRTLLSFEECGLIHHSVDASGQKKYALCSDHCDEHEHHDNHVHFHCTECGKTNCLDNEVPSDLSLPKGYRISEIQFNVMGVCPSCN
jgi:Fur family ferric uptake transcriptional regulator